MLPYVSIVIPAYEEASRLPATMVQLGQYCREATRPLEILLVVERSTDGTLEIARELALQQVQSPHRAEVVDGGPQRGKGHAVRTGMRRAKGELVFYMDADLSVPLREVGAFVARFESAPSAEVLVGNRQHARSKITRSQGWLRRSMGQTFNRIISALSVAQLRDTQCGFKAFRAAAAREIFSRQQIDGFAFDVEVLLLAQRLGFAVEDMPVEWVNSPESRVHIMRDSLRMLRDALRIRRLVDRELARNGGLERPR